MLPIEYSAVCPILVGRAGYVDALRRFVARAQDSSAATGRDKARTLLLSGEAGIGKSRLLEEARSIAQQAGIIYLQGNCYETDRALPYAPFLDLLRTFEAHYPEEAEAYAGLSSRDFAGLLPEHGRRVTGAEGEGTAKVAPDSGPEITKQRYFQAMLGIFLDISRNTPLLIAIEDIHWCDDISLELILLLARRIAGQRIVLLLTYRSDEIQPALAQLLAGLDRERLAQEMNLSQLRMGEVDTMIRAIFSLERPIRTDFLDAIFRLTEGNPFFIEETLKSLIESGDIYYTGDAWDRKPLDELQIPRSVQVALQRRVDGLSQEARDLLALAAVAGRRFDFDLLEKLSGNPETRLVALMKELMRAQLLVEESAETFAFRHALTRQAVYSGLLARERKALHLTTGRIMEEVYAGALDAHLSELAYHFYEANEWDKAFQYSCMAGAEAQRLYAPQAAIQQYSYALEAASNMGLVRPDLYRERGRTYELLGDFEKARDDYQAAIQATRNLEDRLGEWQALLDLGWLWTSRDYQKAGKYIQQAVDLAREIGEPATLAYTLNKLGNWYVHIERPIEGRKCHAEAAALFSELGDRNGLSATLDLLGITSYMGDDVIAGVAYYRQAVPLMRELNDRQALAGALAPLAMGGGSYMSRLSLCVSMPLDEAVRYGAEALEITRKIGWRAGEAMALSYMALIVGIFGEVEQVLDYADKGIRLSEELEHHQWKAASLFALGAMHRDILNLTEARSHFEVSLKTATSIGSLFVMRIASGFLASTMIAQGELKQAEALLKDTFPPDTPYETIGQRAGWLARAELEAAKGRHQQAIEIVARLIEVTPNNDGGQRSIPHLWKVQGSALAALRRFDEASEMLAAAEKEAERRRMLPLLWEVRASLGHVYKRLGNRDEAEKAFARATSAIHELAGKIPHGPLRETFLEKAEASMPHPAPQTPLRIAKQEYSGLTARERDAAACIAQGKTNRAIANELTVGERTIEKHIENIMSKLDFQSRSQIAAWAVEKRFKEG